MLQRRITLKIGICRGYFRESNHIHNIIVTENPPSTVVGPLDPLNPRILEPFPSYFHLPFPKRTTLAVLKSSLKSSPSDQLSIYSRSSFIQSLKDISFRFCVVCHMHVSPGFMESRLLCHSLGSKLISVMKMVCGLH